MNSRHKKNSLALAGAVAAALSGINVFASTFTNTTGPVQQGAESDGGNGKSVAEQRGGHDFVRGPDRLRISMNRRGSPNCRRAPRSCFTTDTDEVTAR